MIKLSRDEMKNLIGGKVAPVSEACNCTTKDDCDRNQSCLACSGSGVKVGYCEGNSSAILN